MANWTDRPDTNPEDRSFEILRTPATGALKGTIISDSAIWTKLHFWHGRSVPCNGPECEPCKFGGVPRWKGYVLLFNERSRMTKILEVTDRVMPAFDGYNQDHGTLRGARITMRRTKPRANGPLQVSFEMGNFDTPQLPLACDLRMMLDRMWESHGKGIESSEVTQDRPLQDGVDDARTLRCTNSLHVPLPGQRDFLGG